MADSSTSIVCDGGLASGSHCCWVNGQLCQYVTFLADGRAWCTVWDEMDTPEWRASPIGQSFEAAYPGRNITCHEWPQDIPEVMEAGIGLCCWSK